MTTIQEHLMPPWKMAESDTMMTNSARREAEDETKEECLAVTVAPMLEGKPSVLLQVNCKSIYNKTLDFWNFGHLQSSKRGHGVVRTIGILDQIYGKNDDR
jgi:hypothetical protein